MDFMQELNKTLLELKDPSSAITGEMAIDTLRQIPYLGELCVLKVLPLSCLVGLCDVSRCFGKVLHGVMPKTKPHTMELVRLGCETAHDQKKTPGRVERMAGGATGILLPW